MCRHLRGHVALAGFDACEPHRECDPRPIQGGTATVQLPHCASLDWLDSKPDAASTSHNSGRDRLARAEGIADREPDAADLGLTGVARYMSY